MVVIYYLSAEERLILLLNEPLAEQWIKPFDGLDEFINGNSTLLFMVSRLSAQTLARKCLQVMKRIEAVKVMRLGEYKSTNQEKWQIRQLYLAKFGNQKQIIWQCLEFLQKGEFIFQLAYLTADVNCRR